MRLAALALCGLAAACTEIEQATDRTARAGARNVVTEVLATRYPQVPKEALGRYVDCIVENSTALEVQEYVKATVRGVDAGTLAAVGGAVSRPETRTCFQTRAGLFL